MNALGQEDRMNDKEGANTYGTSRDSREGVSENAQLTSKE
jgi:hypothetical protein